MRLHFLLASCWWFHNHQRRHNHFLLLYIDLTFLWSKFESSTYSLEHIISFMLSSVCKVVNSKRWMRPYTNLFFYSFISLQNVILRIPIVLINKWLRNAQINFVYINRILWHYAIRTFLSKILRIIRTNAFCNERVHIFEP